MVNDNERLAVLIPLALKALPNELLVRPAVAEAPTWPHTTTPLAWCYEFARFASFRYGLPLPTFDIAFRSLEGHAGNVVDRGRTCVISIGDQFATDLTVLAHIVVHELAHLLINRARIGIDMAATNEVLTDTVAVLAGFGPLMMAGKERSTVIATSTGHSIRTTRVGYLSERELAWLIRVRHHFSTGLPWPRRSLNRRRVDFCTCAVCATRLRLPDLRATIVLRCPACFLKQEVRLRRGPYVIDALLGMWRWIRTRRAAA